jgi:hypothetical protein
MAGWLPSVQRDAQQPVTGGWRADSVALLIRHTGGDELLDPALLVDQRDGAVARVEQLVGLVDDLLQQRVQR